jgi:hypothetical protein
MTNCTTMSRGRCAQRARQSYPLVLLAALAILTPRPSAAQSPTYEALYNFQGSPDGADPGAAGIIGKNGALYGTTYEGGASKAGTAFVLAKPTGEPWKESVLYSFGSDGSYPRAPLVLGSTGALYGTLIGGSVIFELTPPSTAGSRWTQTTLYTVSYLEAIPTGRCFSVLVEQSTQLPRERRRPNSAR